LISIILKTIGCLSQKYYDDMKLTKLCYLNESFDPQSVAYFYSNLSFPSPNEMIFTVKENVFTLSVEELALIPFASLHTFVKYRLPLRMRTKL